MSENHTGSLYAATIVPVVLASFVVALRLYTRVFVVQSCRSDDHLMYLAVLASVVASGFTCIAIPLGLGRHYKSLNREDAIEAMKYLWATQPVNITSFYLSKLSVAVFLLRLVPFRRWSYFLHGIICILTVAWVFALVNMFAMCQPLARFWDKHAGGFCWSPSFTQVSPYFFNAYGIFTDLAFVIIPMILLWRVQIEIRTKVAIIAVLSLGVITAACSVMKLLQFPGLLKKRGDPTFDQVGIIKWSIVELNVGIIAASLPALRPLFKMFNSKDSQSISQRASRSHHIYSHSRGISPGSSEPLKPIHHHNDSDTLEAGAYDQFIRVLARDPSVLPDVHDDPATPSSSRHIPHASSLSKIVAPQDVHVSYAAREAAWEDVYGPAEPSTRRDVWEGDHPESFRFPMHNRF